MAIAEPRAIELIEEAETQLAMASVVLENAQRLLGPTPSPELTHVYQARVEVARAIVETTSAIYRMDQTEQEGR